MLTSLQKRVIAIIAKLRDEGDYMAGGAVLNARHARVSDDLDVFLDENNAVVKVIAALRAAGFRVSEDVVSFGMAEATVRADDAGDVTKIRWMQESALRFFPLQADPEFGYRLHDVDLAVNKAIAAATRKKVRDVVDIAMIDTEIMKLGPLVWAAADSKTPLSPIKMLDSIVHNAAIHSAAEYRMVRSSEPVEGGVIVQRIQVACDEARAFCRAAPVETIGSIFVDAQGRPASPTPQNIAAGTVRPHAAREHGAWPSFPDGERA